MTAAHILIVPFRPSQPDLDTLPYMQEVITQAQDLNPDLQIFGLLTMNPTNPSVHEEAEAREYFKEFPIIPCNLCGSQENLQRQVVKEMLQDWERKTPGRTESIFRSLQNVIPSQLADRNLFDFNSLKIDETAASRFVNVVNL